MVVSWLINEKNPAGRDNKKTNRMFCSRPLLYHKFGQKSIQSDQKSQTTHSGGFKIFIPGGDAPLDKQ